MRPLWVFGQEAGTKGGVGGDSSFTGEVFDAEWGGDGEGVYGGTINASSNSTKFFFFEKNKNMLFLKIRAIECELACECVIFAITDRASPCMLR